MCTSAPITIGGNPIATGGNAPYTYLWTPSTGLNSNTVANPIVTTTVTTTYILLVRDTRDSTCRDTVKITVDAISLMSAANDTDICANDSIAVKLGTSYNYSNPYTFSWSPTTYLSDSTAPNPVYSGSASITYTVTITSPTCGSITDQVTITSHNVDVYAGADTTIYEGETATLHAQPYDSTYTYYWWYSSGTPKYNQTYNPDVKPNDTTDYYLAIKDSYGCVFVDTVRVNVIPSSDLIFYTSISPNGDGDNDTWVIGNIEKYPDNLLKIFNRYGQEIYNKNDYANDWNGTYLGEELPGGTYYFVFETKSDGKKHKGSITIFR